MAKALFFLSLLVLAPSLAFGGPGEGGGPRPCTPSSSELMPEDSHAEACREETLLHPRDQRTNEERDQVVGDN